MSYEIPPEHANTNHNNFNTNNFGGGIWQTAKYGMWGLISVGVSLILSILALPFGGLFNIAGIVLAIMSLVKKENPKWPAFVALGLNVLGILLWIIFFVFIFGLFAIAGASGAFS